MGYSTHNIEIIGFKAQEALFELSGARAMSRSIVRWMRVGISFISAFKPSPIGDHQPMVTSMLKRSEIGMMMDANRD